MGRRPELKSDEFFGETLLVIDVISLLLLKPLKQVMQLLAARPRLRRVALLLARLAGARKRALLRPWCMLRSALACLDWRGSCS